MMDQASRSDPLRLATNSRGHGRRESHRAQRALDALRAELAHRGAVLANVQFIAAGSDHPRQLAVTQPMRELYSRWIWRFRDNCS